MLTDKDLLIPFQLTEKQTLLLKEISGNFDETQLLWLSGYFYGVQAAKNNVQPSINAPVNATKLTILYGSHSGNCKKIAFKTKELATQKGINVQCFDMNDYKTKDLKSETNLLVVVSTHGEGVPPISAEDFYDFLHSARAPKLPDVVFSVLALGDKSYIQYCQTGKDFDTRLEVLGAKRIYPRVDCDVDYEEDADAWIEAVLAKFVANAPANAAVISNNKNSINTTVQNNYSRKNPFAAPILEKIQLNGKGSGKETWHLEISLEGSQLQYEPGDALGIMPSNSNQLVQEVLEALNLDANDKAFDPNIKADNISDALKYHFELSVLNRETLEKHNVLAQSKILENILKDNQKLKDYLYGRDVVDLLKEFPVKYDATTALQTLKKMQPRLYSIASALEAHPDEVHITVGAVRYYQNARNKQGVASTFLADRISVGENLPVFIEQNDGFRLPKDNDKDIIMVGPGTGIAPFRAFMEEREANNAKGKNWLFFGDQHFTTDFLYQLEWQNYLKKGILTRLSLAFSRDQSEKIYVQHKMLAKSKELFAWLEEGAYFYVCGDMQRMANDVKQTLTSIVQKEANISAEAAAAYIKNLQKQKRYLEDVY